MNEQEYQDALSALYDGTADTPVATDDDYLTRRRLGNVAIRAWENDGGYLWNELQTFDASQIIVAGTSTYPAPITFKQASGYVYLLSGGIRQAKYPIVKPAEAQNMDESAIYAYFTGNKKLGYTLHLNPTPTVSSNGFTVKYDYYKHATPTAAPADVIEMADADFVTYSVLSELHKSDGNITGFTAALEEAQNRLKQMEIRQTMDGDTGTQDDNAGFGL